MEFPKPKLMGECNTNLSAYTLYNHLEKYYSHPPKCCNFKAMFFGWNIYVLDSVFPRSECMFCAV